MAELRGLSPPWGEGPPPPCWVVAEDKPGMVNQCLGLAEALGLEPELRLVRPRPPWKWLPPGLWPAPLRAPGPGSAPLAPPWPAVLISSGRYTVALSRAIRRAARGRTFTVYIQDPQVDPAGFDAVVVPRHDRLRGPNVLVTEGALHRITPGRLAAARERFAPLLEPLPRPRVAVLLGGGNRYYRFTPRRAEALGRELAALARDRGAGLALTPSRRTPPEALAALRRALEGVPHYCWDGRGENPYFGLLAWADHLLVTEDSVCMVSEACATGRPVYVVALEGRGPKFEAFHRRLREAGHTRPFRGALDPSWAGRRLDDMGAVAAALGERLAAWLAGRGPAPGAAGTNA